MISFALTFAEPRGRCWKPEPERRGFQLLPRDQQMLMYKTIMFDCYYWIKTQCDARKLENFEETALVKLRFPSLKCHGKDKFTACIFKMPLPGWRLMSSWHHSFTFATVHVTDADVTFVTALECLVKTAKQVYNSMWIALLKHGFVLVKTWLLLLCSSGFYALISPYKHMLWVFIRFINTYGISLELPHVGHSNEYPQHRQFPQHMSFGYHQPHLSCFSVLSVEQMRVFCDN